MLFETSDVARIVFGPKVNQFAKTTIDNAVIKFSFGSVDAPLRAPFGISDPYNGEASDRLSMDLELEHPQQLKMFRALDEAVVDAAVENSVSWFGRKLDEATIRAMHNPLVKEPTKAAYKPMVRTKVKVGASINPTTIFVYKTSKTAKKGSRSDVVRGSRIVPYVSMSSVMFGNKQFGVSLTCETLMVKPADGAIGASIFGDFEVEEDEAKPPAKKAKKNEEEEDSYDADMM